MDWQKFCLDYRLGALAALPKPVIGGLMHRMERLDTDRGSYAVKRLNPSVMRREDARANYAQAERLEARLEQAGAPILPAMTFGGRKLLDTQGESVYVFTWFDGAAVAPDRVTVAQAEKIGAALAGVHRIDWRENRGEASRVYIEWDDYLEKLDSAHSELFSPLLAVRERLYRRQARAWAAQGARYMAICHNDMDCKNVLWKGQAFRIIDLECLSMDDPERELVETALYWSGFDRCQLNETLLRRFLSAYRKAGGCLPADWQAAVYRNTGRLEWLEFCLKRALGVNAAQEPEHEMRIGREQALLTLRQIEYEQAVMPVLMKELNR